VTSSLTRRPAATFLIFRRREGEARDQGVCAQLHKGFFEVVDGVMSVLRAESE